MGTVWDNYFRPFAKVGVENINNYLKKFKNYITQESNNDSNKEDSTFKSKTYRLSKSQLLQLLCYHYLPLSSDGKMDFVCSGFIAKAINVSNRTIQRNNKKLEELGFVKIEKVDIGIFNLEICNYEKSFNNKENNGEGYLNLPINFIKELLKDKTVNHIRIALDAIAIYELSSINGGTGYMHRRQVKSFRNTVAKNTAHNGGILSIFKKLKSIFTVEAKKVNENSEHAARVMTYKVNEEFSPKNVKLKTVEANTKVIMEAISDLDIKLAIEQIDNLIELSQQYGINPVRNALSSYKEEPKKHTINNFGAYIRNIINGQYTEYVFSSLKCS